MDRVTSFSVGRPGLWTQTNLRQASSSDADHVARNEGRMRAGMRGGGGGGEGGDTQPGTICPIWQQGARPLGVWGTASQTRGGGGEKGRCISTRRPWEKHCVAGVELWGGRKVSSEPGAVWAQAGTQLPLCPGQ